MIIDKLNKKIGVLAKTKEGAIAGSVLKWEFLVKANRATVLGDPPVCGLCLKYMTPTCRLCPLCKIKEVCFKNTSTWHKTFYIREELRRHPTDANFRKWRKIAREMLEVLKRLQ